MLFLTVGLFINSLLRLFKVWCIVFFYLLVVNLNSALLTYSSYWKVIKNSLATHIKHQKPFLLVGFLMGTMSVLQKPPTHGAAKRSVSYGYLYIPTLNGVQLVFHSMKFIEENGNCCVEQCIQNRLILY